MHQEGTPSYQGPQLQAHTHLMSRSASSLQKASCVILQLETFGKVSSHVSAAAEL